MDPGKVDLFMMTNAKYFPEDKIVLIKEKLLAADDSKLSAVMGFEKKDPTTLLLVSVFLGAFGIDRFLLGDIGMGLLKLLTLGLCSVLWIIDLFLIQGRARSVNHARLMAIL